MNTADLTPFILAQVKKTITSWNRHERATAETLPARYVELYLIVYRDYIHTNKLDDDSGYLTVSDLINFVHSEILDL